jgi:2C-methyl-D-erythritol 2,4-cyclodiphosphate synthase
MATIVINTDNMNVEQQTSETLKLIGVKEEINA